MVKTRTILAIRNIIVALCLYAAYQPVYCQDRNSARTLPVKAYNVEEGLGQSSVKQIFQDKRGLIWLLTGDGLQFFDGTDFHSFYPPDELTSNVSGNPMNSITENFEGELLISSGTSILKFNSTTGKFSKIDQRMNQFPILLNQYYKAKPLCWIATKGLFMVGKDRIFPVNLHFSNNESIPENFHPLDAVQTKEGGLFIIGSNGFLTLKPSNIQTDTVLNAEWKYLPRSSKYVCIDKNKEFFQMSDGKIITYGENNKFTELYDIGIKEESVLFKDDMDQFWVSDVPNKRLVRISKNEAEEIIFIRRIGKYTDTIHPAVKTIFEDKNGNIWFGTDGNGLLFLPARDLNFDLAMIGFTRCLINYENDIWAGTFKNGLWRMDIDLHSGKRINPDVLNDKLYFFDLFVDPQNRLWAATNQGVYILDKNGTLVKYFAFETSTARFFTICGKTILSTYDELFSCKIGKNILLEPIRKQTNIKEILTIGDSYWVGNHFGLFRKDTVSGLLTSLLFQSEDQLSNKAVYCILQLDSLIWTGTDQGIVIYSTDGMKVPVAEYLLSLKHEHIYSIVPDHQNRIWLSSNKGICCIIPKKNQLIRFTTANMLQSSEFNFNADLIIPPDRIYFGGINGINGLNTRNFKIENRIPEVRLISLSISDTGYQNIPQENHIIQVNWRSPHISGNVFNPDYLPSETLEYSFFLEGYQENWGTPSYNSSFSYRNLPPGNYRLWAKCLDLYKNQGNAKCLLDIVILPPFWKTWWFALLFFLFVTTFLILIFKKFQENKYQKILLKLEQRNAIDKERIRISQDMHDEIGASLTQVSILSEILKKKHENPQETLRLTEKISGISAGVIDDLDEIIWAMNPRNDNLDSFASYVRQHASEYLETAGIKGIFTFPEAYPAILMTSEQRRNVFLVIKESVHNIVKHSNATEVSLHLKLVGNHLYISVSDNGTGFETQTVSENGNGLLNMKKRIEALGGNFSISSVIGTGTFVQFSILLPSEKTHENGINFYKQQK